VAEKASSGVVRSTIAFEFSINIWVSGVHFKISCGQRQRGRCWLSHNTTLAAAGCLAGGGATAYQALAAGGELRKRLSSVHTHGAHTPLFIS